MTRTIRVKYGRPFKKFIRVGPVEYAYLEEGHDGLPPALFLHGLTTNAALWQKVLKRTADKLHGIAIDLMGLGDSIVSPYEDLSVPMQAEQILDLIDRLGFEEVTLVAHDHGGAVAQVVAANHPERVASLVLVDTVSHDHWPIPIAEQALRIARLPGTANLLRATALVGRSRLAWSLAVGPLGYARGYYSPDLIDRDLIAEYLRPFTDPDGRERARRFLLQADSRSTLEVLPRLRRFDRPCRVLWGADDKFLSPSWGIELAAEIPRAEFVLLPYCGYFAPDERPDLVAAHVLELATGEALGAAAPAKS